MTGGVRAELQCEVTQSTLETEMETETETEAPVHVPTISCHVPSAWYVLESKQWIGIGCLRREVFH